MTYNSYSYKRGVTGFYQESQNPLCLVVTQIVVYRNKLHINLHIYYVFEDKFKYPKNYQNPTSTSRDTCKTIFLLFLNWFLFATHINLKRLKKND